MSWHLKLLNDSDADALLAFEKHNQAWFELNIPPREASFYSKRGVRNQIAFFLREYRAGRMLPMLILSGDTIIGRINLSEINTNIGEATLGYRIGEQHTRQGVASFATQAVLELAQRDYAVHTFYALASVDNPGSRRVLEKSGFEEVGLLRNHADVQGQAVDCIEYIKRVYFD
ncbi:ribosomal-protein-alanine N-acetyltransferase [Vibrio xiamenensis]|uniref:Ribosomal-protein-alanine N-acetyltransferase n=1 Tax=Vibrio xiamenensis TaxID=861298 RepID=A0A1G8G7C6_9VIBR|nr:GNAT family protein [Vibrio xiamenensis]SDH90287.1 ribosomal-protein-alanine N-acetyltransferase [Vibrio xiamenensis]